MTLRSLTRDRDDRQRNCVHAFPTGAPHSEQAPGPCERCDMLWEDLTMRQKHVFSAGAYRADTPQGDQDDLNAAAELCRSAADIMKQDVGDLMAELFELAAEDLRMCEAQNSRDPDNPGKTRILPQPWVGYMVKLARALLTVKE
jgi:hypothetical protein